MSNNNAVIAMQADVKILAAEGEETKGPRKFDVVAYTGGAMTVKGYDRPIVVDLAGLQFGKSLIANLDHDSTKRVGHVTERSKEDGQLRLGGIASAATPARDEVINSASEGFIWQASIEANPSKVVEIEAGKTVQVNGQSFDGPIYVARKSTLKGFAFVSHGADDNTIVSIAATADKKDSKMDKPLNEWIESIGFDIETLSAEQLAGLKANYEGKNKSKVSKPSLSNEEQTLDSLLSNEKKKREVVKSITQISAAAIRENPQAIDTIETLSNLAIEGGWEKDKFELELLRATRPQSHSVFQKNGPASIDSKTIEAAICMTAKMDDSTLEKNYDERTLNCAHERFQHGIGLKELFMICARANGHNESYGSTITMDVQRAAFAAPDRRIQAAGGFSTISLSGILSNVANKFLMDGWNHVDSAWRKIAAIRSVRDFKTNTSYSLSGDMQYKKLGPDGEIKHATLGEQSYTNQADTYAAMLAITRKDYTNDDLGALTAVPRRLGRGAALKFNDVFWTEFLDNSTFFASGNSNVSTGAGSALSTADGAAINAAELKFINQTDADGKPVGIMPAIMLVPPTLRNTAARWMGSQLMIGSTALGDGNVYDGRFKVVSSPYMENSSYTGYSAAAWYLLADPMDVPVIEACFLNGREAPIIESSDAEFNQLGVQMRGYHDFGVNLQEYRGGVRSAGS